MVWVNRLKGPVATAILLNGKLRAEEERPEKVAGLLPEILYLLNCLNLFFVAQTWYRRIVKWNS